MFNPRGAIALSRWGSLAEKLEISFVVDLKKTKCFVLGWAVEQSTKVLIFVETFQVSKKDCNPLRYTTLTYFTSLGFKQYSRYIL